MDDLKKFDISSNGEALGTVGINENYYLPFAQMIHDNHNKKVEEEQALLAKAKDDRMKELKRRKALQIKQRILAGALVAVGLIAGFKYVEHARATAPDPAVVVASQVDEVRRLYSIDNDGAAYLRAEQLLNNPYLTEEDKAYIENIIYTNREQIINNGQSMGR